MNDKPSDGDAFLQLPGDGRVHKSANKPDEESRNPAAELIRKKVEAAYAAEPDVSTEITEVGKEVDTGKKLSKHQKFIHELINSGKSVEDIQVAWHDYYASLPDTEKHAVWQEFYTVQELVKQQSKPVATAIFSPNIKNPFWQKVTQATKNAHRNIPEVTLPKPKLPKAVHSLLFGVSMGVLAIIIVLFSFFNERFIAPFIQPSRSLTNLPLITQGTTIGQDPEVIIPKINVEIPVVYDVNTIDESAVESALNNGVVHYADTALPGQNGNVVIVGHSSNNIFNPGKYKFAFVLLSRLEPGDTFYLQKDSKRYTYQVYQKKIVKPADTSVLGPADRPAVATLITCDPPGTSINRLVVTGEQINPDPATNAAQTTSNNLATQSKIIPGNSQSLWSRLTHWLSH